MPRKYVILYFYDNRTQKEYIVLTRPNDRINTRRHFIDEWGEEGFTLTSVTEVDADLSKLPTDRILSAD